MINKLQFNNLIISNKEKIRQAQIQIINKLVRKIKKLNAELDKESVNPKNKDRFRKSMATLQCLKKYKCDDIIKKVLLVEKKPSAVICNQLSTPEEIAIAMLAENKVLNSLIEIFRQQLNLTDENLKWREEIMEPSKRRLKIQRTEEKKRKRIEMKEQKAIARKRQDWIKENNPNISHDSLLTNGNCEDNIFNQESPVDLDLTQNKEVGASNEERIHNEIERAASKTKRDKSNKEPKIKKTRVGAAINSEVKECKTVRQKNSENQLLIADMPNCLEGNYTEDAAEPVATHVLDEFFLTDTGEHYLSTAVRRGRSNVPVKKQDETITDTNQKATNIDKSRNKRVENHESRKVKLASDSGLHPSWAAKQKLKSTITSFQGKKIIFQDDLKDIGNDDSLINQPVPKKGKEKTTKNSSVADNLHPSWVAKQKLKPIISTFQGKKTLFATSDDE